MWSATYSSFLKTDVDPSSTIENNLRAAGQTEDQETGLLYNYHRYYSPAIGRYLKVDPIGLSLGIAKIYCTSGILHSVIRGYPFEYI